MALCVLRKDLEGGGDEADRSVRVLAHAPPGDEPAPLGDAVEDPFTGCPVGKSGEALRDRRQPVDAWAALTSRLAGQIADHARDLAQRTGVRRERRDQDGADGAASGAHLGDAQWSVPGHVHGQPAAVVTTDEHGLDGFAQPTDRVDHSAERSAEWSFNDSVLRNRTAKREQRRARFVGGSDLGVAVAHAGEDRELRQSLGVRQKRRPVVDAAYGGDGAGELWATSPAVDQS